MRSLTGLTIVDQDDHEDNKDSIRYESFAGRSESTVSSEVTVNVDKKQRKKSKKSEFEKLLT